MWIKTEKIDWNEWRKELSVCPLFENMSAEQIMLFLNAVKPRIEYFGKDSRIFYMGQNITAFGIFLNSDPKTEPEKCTEKWRSPNYYHPGWLFAELPAFSEDNRIPFDVFAPCACFILFIDVQAFFCRNMEQDIFCRIQENMIRLLARKSRVLKRCRIFYERKNLTEGLYGMLKKDSVINRNRCFEKSFSLEELAEVIQCEKEELILAWKILENLELIEEQPSGKVLLKEK